MAIFRHCEERSDEAIYRYCVNLVIASFRHCERSEAICDALPAALGSNTAHRRKRRCSLNV